MSHAQIDVKLVEIGLQFGVGEAVDDAAMFHHVIAVRNRRCEAKILLDQENGEALLLERSDGPADLLDDDGGEPLGRLVERSEEHTSELQSLRHLVCRLLLEKKKKLII